MTTTSAPPDGGMTVRVDDLGQLIAAVPHLLGFRPAGSVVVLGFGGATGERVGPVVRGDLPAPEEERESAASLAAVFAGIPGHAVAILIVGRFPGQPPDPGRLPHSRYVTELTAAFDAVGRPVRHAVWTPRIHAGEPWESYREPDRGGNIPDDATTPVAAAVVSRGFVTFDSREEMEQQLDPDDRLAVARRERLIEARIDALVDVFADGVDGADGEGPYPWAASFHEVWLALEQSQRGGLNLSDEQVVRLALALSDHSVRDACLATALPAGSERSRRAEALWLEMVRKSPAPERAEPATLLGYSAYVRGDGAFARAALENALDATPGHTLAELLLFCLDTAMPPDKIAELGRVTDPADLFGPAAPPPLHGPRGGP